jgi:chemotaxis protein MotB
MAKKQKCPPCVQKVPEYMLTYGDMVTLLLTFFIMLFTTGKTNQKDMQIILSVFKSSTGFFEGGQTLSKGSLEELGMNIESLPSQTTGRALAKSKRQATEIFKPEIQEGKVRITEDERGLVISMVGADYFNPGSAILLPPLKETLSKVARFVGTLDRYIRVEGHCDEDAVLPGGASGREERLYINNWDLAAARAVNATSFLINVSNVDKTMFQAVSLGSVRPLVVEEAGSPESRAYNRRIDIVVLTEKAVKRTKMDSNYKLPKAKLPNTESQY